MEKFPRFTKLKKPPEAQTGNLETQNSGESPKPGELTASALATELRISNQAVQREAEKHRTDHPEWFNSRQIRRGVAEHLDQQLAERIRHRFSNYLEPLVGESNRNALAKNLGVSDDTIKSIADRFRESKADWFNARKPKVGNPREYYSADLVGIIKKEVTEHSLRPAGWENANSLRMKLLSEHGFQLGNTTIPKIVDDYRVTKPTWFQNYKISSGQIKEHFHPDLVKIITEQIQEKQKHEPPLPGEKTQSVLAEDLHVSDLTISKKVATFRISHPEWFNQRRDPKRGSAHEYLAPELVKLLTKEIGVRERPELKEKTPPPTDWVSLRELSKNLNTSRSTVKDAAEKLKSEYLDASGLFQGKQGRDAVYYRPDLVSAVTEALGSKAPEKWMNLAGVVKEVGADYTTISKKAERLKPDFADQFGEYRSHGGKTTFFSPAFVEAIKREVPSLPPKEWKNITRISEEIGIGYKAVLRIVEEMSKDFPNESGEFRSSNNKGASLYLSPNLVLKIQEKLVKPPENWKTINELRKQFGTDTSVVQRIVSELKNKYEHEIGQFASKVGVVTFYGPELIQAIGEKIPQKAPEGWKTINSLALENSNLTVWSLASAAEKLAPLYPLESGSFRSQGGSTTYYSENICKLILEKVRSESLEKDAEVEKSKLEFECDSFFEQVLETHTIEAEEFLKLLNIFGSAHAVDILYKYRPDFKGISVERVKGSLAKYLGDFLILRHSFKIDDLDLAYPHLSNQTLKDSLFEIVKGDCLSRYHIEKLKDPTLSDSIIIERYLSEVKNKAESLGSSEIEEIANRVEAYYSSILNDFSKPNRIVKSIKEGRPFPDLNQTLNVKEIADKKKMLIGDEMGMGKSASAILSKEYLGSKLALAIVPSNVMGTWQNYLSDKVGEEGEQIGYFKSEQAPRVLVVEDAKTLAKADTSKFEYILISQEKMNARYVELLKKTKYDMLIIDEVHKFKNLEGGARSASMFELANEIDSESEHLVLLSGTPIPNKIHDVATILKLLYPERFSKIEDAELVESAIRGDIVDIRNLLVPHMQMKSLRESIQMPELFEETHISKLSEEEKDIYEILFEDDELTASQKIQAFRQFVMNPSSLEITPGIQGSKIGDVGNKLKEVFKSKKKVVFFVNGYVEGMIRGEHTIIEQLGLPRDVQVRVIEGKISKEEREQIQEEFKSSDEKILLAVSGQTADVGVDFSSAEYMEFYNDPWTLYDKKQQIARGYRPGLKNDLTVGTSVVEGTIEEGIAEYIQLKYDAIQKVLKGVPITEIEKDILRTAEKQKVPDIEGSLEVAKEWLNSPQNRLHRFFAMTKEIGEKEFHKFLLEHGEEYAESYLDMGSLGYQANTGRIVGSIINNIAKAQKQDPHKLRILDIASGPEMLKKHAPDAYKESVFSMDINPRHFENRGENRIVGSFGK